MFGNNNGRQVGVRVSQGQLAQGEAPVGKVTHVAPCQFFAVRFGDAHGKAHQAVILKAGNELYWMPNGEEWSRQLTTISTEYKQQILSEIEAQQASIPAQDEVDIVSSGVSDETS